MTKQNKIIEGIMEEYRKEFIKDNGANVEYSFRDANGDGGRSVVWLTQKLQQAYEQARQELIAELEAEMPKEKEVDEYHKDGVYHEATHGYNAALSEFQELLNNKKI